MGGLLTGIPRTDEGDSLVIAFRLWEAWPPHQTAFPGSPEDFSLFMRAHLRVVMNGYLHAHSYVPDLAGTYPSFTLSLSFALIRRIVRLDCLDPVPLMTELMRIQDPERAVPFNICSLIQSDLPFLGPSAALELRTPIVLDRHRDSDWKGSILFAAHHYGVIWELRQCLLTRRSFDAFVPVVELIRLSIPFLTKNYRLLFTREVQAAFEAYAKGATPAFFAALRLLMELAQGIQTEPFFLERYFEALLLCLADGGELGLRELKDLLTRPSLSPELIDKLSQFFDGLLRACVTHPPVRTSAIVVAKLLADKQKLNVPRLLASVKEDPELLTLFFDFVKDSISDEEVQSICGILKDYRRSKDVLLHFFNERELSFDVSEALTQLLLLNDIKVNDTFVTGLSKRPRLRPSLQTAIENLNQTSADFDLATVLRILKEWGTKRFRLNLFADRVLMAFDANRLLAFFELFPFVEIADYEMVFAFCPHVPPFFSFFREYHADHLADFTDEWLKIEDYSPEFRALLIACYDQTQNAAFLWKAAVLVGEEPEDEFIGYCQAAIEDTPAELKPLIIQALETDLRHSFWDLLHRLDLSNFSFADCQLPSLDLRQESLAFLLETGYNVPESVVRSLAASEIDFVRHTAIQKGYNLPSDQSPSNDDLFVTILELVATGNYEMGFTQFDAFLQRISDPTAEFLIRLWDFFVGDQAPAIIRRSTTIATLMNLFQHAPRALVTVLSNTRFAETCEIRPNVQSPVLAVAANLRTLLLTETSLLEVFRDFNFSPSPAIAYRCPQEFGELQRRMTPASFAQFHILVHTESRIEPVFEIAALSGKSVSESLAQYVFESPILNTPAILSIFCETLESTDVVLDEYVFLNGVRYRLSSVLNRDGAAFLVVDGVPGFLKYENSSVTRVAAVEGTLSDLFYERYPPLTASELHAFSLGYGGTSVVSKVLHDPAINWSALFSKPEFDQFAPALYAAQRIPQLLSLYQRDRAFAVEFFNDWRGSADNCLDNPAFVAAHGAHVLSLALAHPDPLELGVAILRRCERPDLALQILSRVQTDKHLPIWREACRSDTVLDSPAFSQFALSIFRQAPDPTLLLADTSLTDKLFAALVQTDALLELALSVPAVRAFVIERAPREVLLRALKLPSVGADFALAARPRLADSPDVIYVLEKLGDDALRANPGSVFSLLQGEAHERAFALTLRLWPPDGPADPALRDFLSQADVSQLPSVIARYAAWLTDSLPILRYIWSGAAGPHWETLVEAAAALPRAPDSALSELAAAPHGEGKLWACSVLRIAAVFPNGIGFLSPEAIEGPLASALSLFDAAELEALARPLLARVTDATLPLSFANIALFARFPRLLVPHFPAFAALTRLAPVALLRLLPLCDDGAFVSLTAAVLASNSTADAGAWALPPPELAQRLEKWLPLAAPTTAFFSLVRDSLRVCPECTPAVVAQFCAAPPAVSAELRLTYGQFLLAVWDFIAAPPERIALLGRWLSLIVDVLCQTVAPPRFPLADALPLLAALNRPFFPAFQRRIPGIQPALLNRLCATPELLLLANGEPANPREISAVKRLFTNIRIAKRAPNTDCAGAFVAGIRAGETHKLDLLAFLVRKFDQAFDKRALTAQTGASNARQAILQALLGKRVN